MFTSKETSIAGVLAFIVALSGSLLAYFDADPETNADWNEVVVAASVMIGLLRARDNNKTSESVGAK